MAIGVLLSSAPPRGRHLGMAGANGKSTREERLAAKLRENLRRRKAQQRELERPAKGPGKDEDDSLPKQPVES